MRRIGFRLVSGALIGTGACLLFYEVVYYLVEPWETFSVVGGIFLGLVTGIAVALAPLDKPPDWVHLVLGWLAVPALAAVAAWSAILLLPADPIDAIHGWFYVIAFGTPAGATWIALRGRLTPGTVARLSLNAAVMTAAWGVTIGIALLAASGGPDGL